MTAVLAPAPNPVDLPLRISFAAHPASGTLACLRSDARQGVTAELLATDGGGSRVVAVPGLGLSAQLLPLGPDTLLIFSHRDAAHQVDLVTVPDGDAPVVRRLGEVSGATLRLLPAGPLTRTGVLALAASLTPDGRTTLRAVTRSGLAARPLVELPGLFGGGTWAGAEGRLAGWLSGDGAPADGVLVDPVGGAWSPVFRVNASTTDRLVGGTGQLLVAATDAGGRHRLGYGEDPTRLRFPTALTGDELTLLGCAGRRLLVAADAGAGTRLLLADARTDTVTVLDAGAGVACGPAVLAADAAHLPWATPEHPARLRRLDLHAGAGRARPAPRAPGARLETFPGADGPVEAVVLGDPATADTVVLALHGGPLAAWRLGFDPLLAGLADHGAAVVAVNQRGSTGYGTAHALAIRDAWGGPDLDDVLSVAAALRRRRGPGAPLPVLLGTSYGGFLALLAAALEPTAWSGCIALAPFISGPRLLAATGGPIRRLLERLGGDVPLRDERGVRDAYERCPEIEVPVLVVHGGRDDVVPVSESRALVDRLRTTGRACAVEYLELPAADHELTTGPHRRAVFDRVVASAAFPGTGFRPDGWIRNAPEGR
jgi:alpha-beta hydrolase superfamily lysophospholipase